MSTAQDTQKIHNEMYKFMGEMRSSSEHRGEMLDELKEDLAKLKKEIVQRDERVEASIRSTNEKVDGLLSKITKWESKLGAFVFLVGCVWTFFVTFKDDVLRFIKG